MINVCKQVIHRALLSYRLVRLYFYVLFFYLKPRINLVAHKLSNIYSFRHIDSLVNLDTLNLHFGFIELHSEDLLLKYQYGRAGFDAVSNLTNSSFLAKSTIKSLIWLKLALTIDAMSTRGKGVIHSLIKWDKLRALLNVIRIDW